MTAWHDHGIHANALACNASLELEREESVVVAGDDIWRTIGALVKPPEQFGVSAALLASDGRPADARSDYVGGLRRCR